MVIKDPELVEQLKQGLIEANQAYEDFASEMYE